MTPPRMIALEIPGEAVPFARARNKGKQRFNPAKQEGFMTAVGYYASKAMAGEALLAGPLEMQVRAIYLVPDSWSRQKKDSARWKSSKPDADNIAKILKDAMNKIVFTDDAQVASLTVQKIYGDTAKVIVTIAELA